MKKLLLVVLLFPVVVFAQDTVPAPDIFAKIMAGLTSVEGLAAMGAVALELLLQVIKTDKPKSLLLGLAVILEKTAMVLSKAGSILQRVAGGEKK